MAKTIDHMGFYVAVKPYTTEGNGDQVFNTLSMSVSYTKGKGFRANYHPGWKTGWDGFGCVFDFGSNPLTGTTYVDIEAAAKNNVKRLTQFKTNLEAAKDDIVWLFDERNWAELKRLVKDVAVCGYTYSIEERIKELRRYQNSDSTETTINQNNTTMATVEMNNETKNVQNAQVNNPSNEAIDVNVGEVTVDSIMPVMQPVEGSEYTVESGGKTATFESMAPNFESEEFLDGPSGKAERRVKSEESATPGKPAVTVPLDDHGTLVIGGVPKPKVTLKRKVQDSVPQAAALPLVRLVVYTTKRGEQAPRIEGFGGENDPRWKRHYDEKVRLAKEKKEADAFNEKLQAQMKGKPKAEREKLRKQWKSVGSDPFNAGHFTDLTTGDKTYHMLMGAKYLDVARELVDAYNSGDEQAIAAAEQAVIDCKNGIVKDIEAQRDAKRAEREAKRSEKGTVKSEKLATAQAAMSAEDAAMFDLFKKFMAGDKDAMAKVGAVLNKAA